MDRPSDNLTRYLSAHCATLHSCAVRISCAISQSCGTAAGEPLLAQFVFHYLPELHNLLASRCERSGIVVLYTICSAGRRGSENRAATAQCHIISSLLLSRCRMCQCHIISSLLLSRSRMCAPAMMFSRCPDRTHLRLTWRTDCDGNGAPETDVTQCLEDGAIHASPSVIIREM